MEENLAGRADKIKATSIAIDVYNRGASFDQQSDPLVRVQAGRLRHHLAEYYIGDGQGDPLVIEIPKGGYRPTFTRRLPSLSDKQPDGEVAEAVLDSGLTSRYILPITAVVIGVLLVLTLGLLYEWYERETPQDVAFAEIKPYIVVMPVATTSSDQLSANLATGLVESLITNLSKISGLSVMRPCWRLNSATTHTA